MANSDTTPPAGKCRQCQSPLVRDANAKRPRWSCPNIYCTARVKPGTFIGTTRVLSKKGR